ncbi:hypothetical protein JX266_009012 [Neoarthrinium moseri]|nr:hypothetical protein JX266_009012 [Neoarthrinium moseri]
MAPAKHVPPEEWEVHRAEIRRLYIDEDRTLQYVMGVLSQQRGFTASQKQYKTKLKHWRLFKNNRAADVAAILKTQAGRTAAGKDSIPVRNGRRVDTRTYLRRKGVSADDLLLLAGAGSTPRSADDAEAEADLPAYLRCLTPPPPFFTSTSPLSSGLLRTPGSLGIKEVVGEWFLGECRRFGGEATMQSESWDGSWQNRDPMCERPLQVYCDSHASTVAAEYYDAIWLLNQNHTRQGWQLAHTVFDRLRLLLDDAAHLLYPVLNLLIIIVVLPDDGHAALHRTLWGHLAELARIRLGPAHPCRRALRQIARLFEEEHDAARRNGLLLALVLDAMDNLADAAQYYDMVSLWYGETLRSHRSHRLKGNGGGGSSPPSLAAIHPGEMLRALADPEAAPPVFEEDEEEAGAAAAQEDDLSLAYVESFLLLDLGWESGWRDAEVYGACERLLAAKTERATAMSDTAAPAAPDQTEVNCLTAMALFHRAQCGEPQLSQRHPDTVMWDAGADVNMGTGEDVVEEGQTTAERWRHHEFARHLMQEAVALDWALSGPSIYNFEGLLLLREWCTEAEDWAALEVVGRRSEECLRGLFGEWGVSC